LKNECGSAINAQHTNGVRFGDEAKGDLQVNNFGEKTAAMFPLIKEFTLAHFKKNKA
jgi:hypothetical protein